MGVLISTDSIEIIFPSCRSIGSLKINNLHDKTRKWQETGINCLQTVNRKLESGFGLKIGAPPLGEGCLSDGEISFSLYNKRCAKYFKGVPKVSANSQFGHAAPGLSRPLAVKMLLSVFFS